MKKIFSLFAIIHFIVIGAFSQNVKLDGSISNLPNEYIYIFECRLDSLILIDSVTTDKNGNFKFAKTYNEKLNYEAIFKIQVRDQHMYFLNTEETIIFKTEYKYDFFENYIFENLTFTNSKTNSDFVEFQNVMKKLNLAKEIIWPFLQAFPQTDSFHQIAVKEFDDRFLDLNSLMDSYLATNDTNSSIFKIMAAFTQPYLMNWKLSLPERKQLARKNFFNHFNPADDFYVHTNIIPEKLDQWLSLSLPDSEKEVIDEKAMFQAAKQFLDRVKQNDEIFRFCLDRILHKFYYNRLFNAFVSTYDHYPTQGLNDCSDETDDFLWARDLATSLKNIELGRQAPNFQVYQGLSLNDVMSDYIVIVFWATWCSHCQFEIPEFKNRMNKIKSEYLPKSSVTIVAVSLDRDELVWKAFIEKNNLKSWLNTSELKGWNGEISMKFNIYATPSYVILDKGKKLLAFPENIEQVENFFRNQNTLPSTKLNK